MHVFLFSGIAVSLLITEFTGFSAGGVVVAGYLAMFALQPSWLIGTMIIALLTHGIVKKVQSHMLLYGRRLFAIYIITGMVISQMISGLFMVRSISDHGIMIIGYLIPGLIARDFSRQGIGWTILWLTVAVLMTRLIVLAGEGMLW
ncbi:MAG: CapC protein [Firmicutes bacterium]|nr:CapC protein [Bacillota bacterium]